MASGSAALVAKKTSSTRSKTKVTPSPKKVTPSLSKVSTRKSSKMQPEVETPNKKKMAKSPSKDDGKQQQKAATESSSTVKSKRSTKNVDTKVIVVDKPESGDSKFECEYCQKGFKRKYDMEKHARKHSGEKPYKCGICGNQVKKFCVLDL